MNDITQFSTAELVAELKTRHELCPVVDEMTRDPVCLFVMTTESLVKELSKRDGVECMDIGINRLYMISVSHEGSLREDIEFGRDGDGPCAILVVRE